MPSANIDFDHCLYIAATITIIYQKKKQKRNKIFFDGKREREREWLLRTKD